MFLSSCKSFIIMCVNHVRSVDLFNQAAALAYTTMFSLVPLLVVALLLLGSLPVFSGFRVDVEQYLLSHLIIESVDSIKQYLVTFIHQAQSLSVGGIAVLGVSALLLFFEIGGSFDKIWQVDKVRKGYLSTMLYVVFFLFVPVFFTCTIIFEYYIANFFHNINWITTIILNSYTFLVSALMFSIFYKVIPSSNVKITAAGFGGIIAAILFILFRKAFVLYFGYFSNYKVLYGALYALPVFMLWLYVSWLIILFGAVVSYILQNRLK
jgi:membrane protein